jgi:hypothetical protein
MWSSRKQREAHKIKLLMNDSSAKKTRKVEHNYCLSVTILLAMTYIFVARRESKRRKCKFHTRRGGSCRLGNFQSKHLSRQSLSEQQKQYARSGWLLMMLMSSSELHTHSHIANFDATERVWERERGTFRNHASCSNRSFTSAHPCTHPARPLCMMAGIKYLRPAVQLLITRAELVMSKSSGMKSDRALSLRYIA